MIRPISVLHNAAFQDQKIYRIQLSQKDEILGLNLETFGKKSKYW
jgi:hypothetical protein